nr:hypothetical protein [Tanacetum cinerariifolium]
MQQDHQSGKYSTLENFKCLGLIQLCFLVGGYLEENAVLVNIIALLRLAIRSSAGRNEVLYAGLVVEEMCKIVEQLVKVVEESLKIVDDTEMDCNEVDDCCSKDVCFVIVVPRTPIVPY